MVVNGPQSAITGNDGIITDTVLPLTHVLDPFNDRDLTAVAFGKRRLIVTWSIIRRQSPSMMFDVSCASNVFFHIPLVDLTGSAVVNRSEHLRSG